MAVHRRTYPDEASANARLMQMGTAYQKAEGHAQFFYSHQHGIWVIKTARGTGVMLEIHGECNC